MEGHAIDLRVPGVATAKLRDAALSLRAGGVGYYPVSQFVHVDVGPVREWVFGSKQRRMIGARTRRVGFGRGLGGGVGEGRVWCMGGCFHSAPIWSWISHTCVRRG